ncbi:MAG: hypothetical protein BWK78_07835 [Thiotrichaceae bacterium IS1]|nr:MAG: hypothetical protein BWK78_07835 [Thiotrichaceae bacterium IS1]
MLIYVFLYEIDPHKLITGVECQFPAIQMEQMALLDTGSELSVAGSTVYQWFFYRNVSLGEPVGQRSIHTRLGTFEGHLYRLEVKLTAHWGESLTVEGTLLFCEHWTGPTVLGFHGFLERLRFAIDPNYEQVGCIYFAAAD